MSIPKKKQKPVKNLIKQLLCASALAAGTLGIAPAFAQTPPPLAVSEKQDVAPHLRHLGF
jgi:hypothetical protein